MDQSSLLRTVAIAHAIYYGITGIWPLVHMKSFIAVTGPKTDLWLVRTVGVLVTAIAIPIFTAAVNGRIDEDIMILAVGGALGLTAIDVVYVMKRVIARIYLVDAGGEVILIGAWIVAVSV